MSEDSSSSWLGWVDSILHGANQQTLQHHTSYIPTLITQSETSEQLQTNAEVPEIIIPATSMNQFNQIDDSLGTSNVVTDTTLWDEWVQTRDATTRARYMRPILYMSKNQQIIREFLIPREQASELLVLEPAIVSSDGIGRLPTELLIIIFDYCRSIQVPYTNIMLVSRHWYATMLSPTLWTEIILRLPKKRNNVHATRLLDIKRRLYLSKNAPLDVAIVTETIELTDPVDLFGLPNHADGSDDYVPLGTIIRLCDTHRWRSLSISRTGTYLGYTLDFDMPALRSLTLCDSTLEFFTSSGLFRVVEKMNHSLSHVDLPSLNTHVRTLLQSPAMASLRTFKAPSSEIFFLKRSQVSQELEITTQLPIDSSQWQLESITLPTTLRMHNCAARELRSLNFDYVQHLTIKTLQGSVSSPETIIPCPALKTLIVEKNDFSSILYISSPTLHSFHIGTPDIGAAAYRTVAEKDTTIILRDLPHHIKIEPRMLVCNLPLSTETTMFLLERWPQLEMLSLRVAEPFDAEWLLAGLLRRKKIRGVTTTANTPWKYVPELKRLRLVVDGSGDWNDWDCYAKRVIKGRNQSELDCMSWICGSGEAGVLYREDS